MSSRAVLETIVISADSIGAAWSLNKRRSALLHHHAELEVNLVRSGHAVYIIGERRFHITRRTLLWLFPQQSHLLIEQSDDFSMHIAVWRPEAVNAACTLPATRFLATTNSENALISQITVVDYERLTELWDQCSHPAHIDHSNALLRLLLIESQVAFSRGEATIAGRTVHPSVEKAARVLVQRSVELEGLSREVGLSPSRLSRLFKSQIGISISHFRAQKQIERFMSIYDGQNYSLSEAASRAGFGSYAQFNRVFREIVGYNPATHRRKLRAHNSTR